MSKDVDLKEKLEVVQPLSAREKMKLAELERRIVQDFGAFFRVGQALAEINELKLYRESHKTFEMYCKDLWDMARGTAYRHIAAAEVVENVSKLETKDGPDLLPVNEAQVRPLTRLKPDQQAAVWRLVLDNAGPEGKVTASLVNRAVKGYLGEKVVKAIRKATDEVRKSPVSKKFIEAFETFSAQIIREKESDYKLTARAEIVKRLDQLRAEIAEDGDLIEGPAFHGGSNDANKLARAGYRLFRTDRSSMTIKESSGGGWKKHSGPFDTIKAMDEELKAILQDEKHLRG
ncbi:MAG: hypothetical protein ACYC4A_01495 [Desulfobulbia bacterium]